MVFKVSLGGPSYIINILERKHLGCRVIALGSGLQPKEGGIKSLGRWTSENTHGVDFKKLHNNKYCIKALSKK